MLGKPPAFPGHEVPGKMVGYMPQVRPLPCKIHTSLFNALIIFLLFFFNILVFNLSGVFTNPYVQYGVITILVGLSLSSLFLCHLIKGAVCKNFSLKHLS